MEELLYPPVIRPARGALAKWLTAAAEGLAWAGGVTLLGLMTVSLVSIVGRKLGVLSLTGDVETLQMGMAVATAAFFPLCTLRGEHLRVEFFTEHLPSVTKRRLDAAADLLLCAVMGLLAGRTWLQVLDGRDNGEVSSLLGVPLWLPVAAMVPSLGLTALCALYRAVTELLTPEDTP